MGNAREQQRELADHARIIAEMDAEVDAINKTVLAELRGNQRKQQEAARRERTARRTS
jgi:hypothetical protein